MVRPTVAILYGLHTSNTENIKFPYLERYKELLDLYFMKFHIPLVLHLCYDN